MFNQNTKREVIRRTYKVLGHEPQPLTQPEYEMTEDSDVTVTSVSIDTTAVSEDIDDYQYLVGTLHRDTDDFELYRTVSVVIEEFDVE